MRDVGSASAGTTSVPMELTPMPPTTSEAEESAPAKAPEVPRTVGSALAGTTSGPMELTSTPATTSGTREPAAAKAPEVPRTVESASAGTTPVSAKALRAGEPAGAIGENEVLHVLALAVATIVAFSACNVDILKMVVSLKASQVRGAQEADVSGA